MSRADFVQARVFYPTVDALASEIAAFHESGDLDAALTRIQAFVQAVILDRRAVAKVFADPVLDAWCQRIGLAVARQLPDSQAATDAGRVDCVILATELYRAGGHTAVMEDLVQTTGRFGPDTVILMTDALHTANLSIVKDRFGTAVRGEIAPAGNLVDKLRWTLSRLAALRPRQLMLFNHHHDPVAIAAAQPGVADETVFYHHADHQLCLGVTLQHTLHVDPHPMGFHHCRESIGLENNVYWPLVVKDQGWAPLPVDPTTTSGLCTCSSGSPNKFEHDYKYQYVDVLPHILSITRGTHIHIGPLSDETIAHIHAGLDARQVNRKRFVHVPWVRSVWKTLCDYRVDLYLASFPLGGGRVLIEAMGAGVPIIAHDCYLSPFMGGKDMLYPQAFVWRHPDQLFGYLARLQRQYLAAEGKSARLHYERHHTGAVLRECIDAGFATKPAPPMRAHVGDPLQEFLDDVHYALRDHLTAAEVAPVFSRRDLLESELLKERTAREIQSQALEVAYVAQTNALMQRYAEENAALRAALAQIKATKTPVQQ
ncbi:glycosyltransferase family protein [Paraburkholderia diazotrophica]|uniref:Uncharacterized protein n=1 Tax=Paraburkholderia diazotrophica TaxID=667676 RepID=A0A1H7DS79_9BURK|nr:glycosyltransferase family 4 protein [Paraburkholderia diazotrophica]SEK02160.1 hypothetical protein SAMN05192539_103133 [Paraburkholderia diazotrophica]